MIPIILHMGAHKTGTTSFQLWLRDNADLLRKSGTVSIVDAAQIRSALGGNAKPTSAQDAMGLRNIITSAANEADASRVIVSFEGFLGDAIVRGKNGLYPHRTRALGHMADALGDIPIEIAYTVRRQSDLLESYFLQLLKQGVPATFEQFVEGLNPASYSWGPIVRDLRRIGNVSVFQYEKADEPINVRLAKRYVGASPIAAEFKSANITYSERAMDIATKVLPLLNTKPEKAALRNFLTAHFCGKDERRPALLSTELRAEMDGIYTEDLSKLLAT